MEENLDIDELINDREKFGAFVYTHLEDALHALKEREGDEKILDYLKNNLPAGVPEILRNKKCAFLSRDVATPNYEALRFLGIVDAIDNELTPVFWEYSADKFTPNVNEAKYSLGKMTFYLGQDKNSNQKVNKVSILDFNTENGKKISDVKTLWGQSLSDFHHELLHKTEPHLLSEKTIYFDASEWYLNSGTTVANYYKHIFALFLHNGILFENFLLNNEREKVFVKEVFLPAFIKVFKETGVKPLMVALDPTDMEGSSFWMYYPQDYLSTIKSKLDLI